MLVRVPVSATGQGVGAVVTGGKLGGKVLTTVIFVGGDVALVGDGVALVGSAVALVGTAVVGSDVGGTGVGLGVGPGGKSKKGLGGLVVGEHSPG
jgi:hypothetical protein